MRVGRGLRLLLGRHQARVRTETEHDVLLRDEQREASGRGRQESGVGFWIEDARPVLGEVVSDLPDVARLLLGSGYHRLAQWIDVGVMAGEILAGILDAFARVAPGIGRRAMGMVVADDAALGGVRHLVERLPRIDRGTFAAGALTDYGLGEEELIADLVDQ